VVGALAFAAVGHRLNRRAVFTWGFLLVTAWYPVAAAFPPLALLVLAKAVSGVASGPLNPVIDTVFFERVPAGLRGRVFGVTQATAWIAMPVGVLLAGPLVEAFGLRATLLVSFGAYFAVALSARLLPSLRGLDGSSTPPQAAETPAPPVSTSSRRSA
jgi:MFS family permease